jgi:hypothetical protein
MGDMEFKEITNGERSRTYIYSGNHELTIKNVVRVCVRPSGTHRLETKDGEKLIVAGGWMAIKIDADTWSF